MQIIKFSSVRPFNRRKLSFTEKWLIKGNNYAVFYFALYFYLKSFLFTPEVSSIKWKRWAVVLLLSYGMTFNLKCEVNNACNYIDIKYCEIYLKNPNKKWTAFTDVIAWLRLISIFKVTTPRYSRVLEMHNHTFQTHFTKECHCYLRSLTNHSKKVV